MYFSSLGYIFCFLPIVIIFYFFLNKKRLISLGKYWLIAASVFFYASFNLYYTPLLLGYIGINFCFYRLIRKNFEQRHNAKNILIFAIFFNLLVLCGFKYCNFFIDTINFAFKNAVPYVNIIIPLALSLQTLQQIGFLVDSYNNKDVRYTFSDYCLFSIFFPQLIVGPIIKYNETVYQFNNIRKKVFNHKKFIMGVTVFLVGFYKKSFFAASLDGAVADKIAVIPLLSTAESWLLCILGYLSVYFELSGLIDMAIGSAMMLNIDLPVNFNSPFQAKNIVDFWERWQITFARFMKNYVYLPIKSLNSKSWFVDFSIMLTCFLGGLWQGTSVCAFIWGILHGFGFVIHRAWKNLNFKLPDFVCTLLTFLFISYTGMLFKTKYLSEMFKLTYNMFTFEKIDSFNVSSQALTFVSSGIERNWMIFPIVILIVCLFLTIFKVSIEGKDLAKYVKPNFIWTFIIAVAIVELLYFYTPPARYMYYDF